MIPCCLLLGRSKWVVSPPASAMTLRVMQQEVVWQRNMQHWLLLLGCEGAWEGVVATGALPVASAALVRVTQVTYT